MSAGPRVAWLRRIADSIETVREVTEGQTGYLDDWCVPVASCTKGRDKWGRIFVTVAARTQGRDDGRTYLSSGVLTVFQRYTQEDIVTQANNSNGAPLLCLGGAASDDDMDLLEQLVRTGTADRVVNGVIGGTLYESWELSDRPDRIVEVARDAIRVAG